VLVAQAQTHEDQTEEAEDEQAEAHEVGETC
jgi:hypothetical protein